jgi:hypothetical protein
MDKGKKTWRYGMAPMHYPTHNVSHLVSLTGERLVEVTCHGYGDGQQCLKDNVYGNPFWNETAFFKSNNGTPMRVMVWWNAPVVEGISARWMGRNMSFYASVSGGSPLVIKRSKEVSSDDAGFVINKSNKEEYRQKNWWQTDMLPEPLRHDSPHQGSHCFISHEFVDAVAHNRTPTVNVYEALAYTVPGIVAHKSAMEGGTLLKIPQFDPKV